MDCVDSVLLYLYRTPQKKENENISKIGQNIKYDLLLLKWYGIEVKGFLWDTMLAHYLLEPDMRPGMDFLSETYLIQACFNYRVDRKKEIGTRKYA